MAQQLIGVSMACGNTVDVVCYTVPAGYVAILDGFIGTNTTAGSLNLTISIGNRVGVTYIILSATAIAAHTTTSFNKGTTQALATVVLNAGETILGQGSGAGINLTLSGVLTSV